MSDELKKRLQNASEKQLIFIIEILVVAGKVSQDNVADVLGLAEDMGIYT